MSMLDLNGIEKTFNPGSVNQKKALRGLELHLEEGDFVTVIGGNGVFVRIAENGMYITQCVVLADITEVSSLLRKKQLYN